MIKCLSTGCQTGASLQATWALVSKNYETKANALRDVFFHSGTDETELEQLQLRFAANASPLTLVDLKKLRVRA